MSAMFESGSPESTAVLVFGVLGLASGGQGLINSMLDGDQGLRNFLSDGQGFSGSGYKPKQGAEAKKDPLPWLKLPKLDFVEVAGQDDDDVPSSPASTSQLPIGSQAEKVFTARLEEMAAEMRQCLKDGETDRAAEIREQIETLCAGTGFSYQPATEEEQGA